MAVKTFGSTRMHFVDSYFKNGALIDTENCFLLQIFCCKVCVKEFDVSYPLRISTFNLMLIPPVSQRTNARSNQRAPKCCAKEPGLLDIQAEKEGKDLPWSKKKENAKNRKAWSHLYKTKTKQHLYNHERPVYICPVCVSPVLRLPSAHISPPRGPSCVAG